MITDNDFITLEAKLSITFKRTQGTEMRPWASDGRAKTAVFNPCFRLVVDTAFFLRYAWKNFLRRVASKKPPTLSRRAHPLPPLIFSTRKFIKNSKFPKLQNNNPNLLPAAKRKRKRIKVSNLPRKSSNRQRKWKRNQRKFPKLK